MLDAIALHLTQLSFNQIYKELKLQIKKHLQSGKS